MKAQDKLLTKLSLKARIFLSFLAVTVFTMISIGSAISLFLKRDQGIDEYLKTSLNAAKNIYVRHLDGLKKIIGVTAINLNYEAAGSKTQNFNDQNRLNILRKKEELDILNYISIERLKLLLKSSPGSGGLIYPLIPMFEAVMENRLDAADTVVLPMEALAKEDNALYKAAIVGYSNDETQDYSPAGGMFIVAAAPLFAGNGELKGIVYGGRLINNSNTIVNEIKSSIFSDQAFSEDAGIVTIFNNYRRISTTLKTQPNKRSVGTVLEDINRHEIITNSAQQVKKIFVIDDWYMSAYAPITNIVGNPVGILGIGVLEKHFRVLQKQWMLVFILSIVLIIGFTVALGYLLTRNIMKPLSALLKATNSFAQGEIKKLPSNSKTPGEIAELEKAFNHMVDAVIKRDEKIKELAQKEIMKAERLAMVGRLSAGVAHEINNPLGGILLFSNLLLQKIPHDSPYRENIERIEKDAKRCQNIVQGLLNFARQREPQVSKVNINDVLSKTLELFEKQAMFHNIEIVKEYCQNLPMINADFGQLQQVFINMIINAADAMGKKGVLKIKTALDDTSNMVAISIMDNGSGIDPKIIDNIFEPFFTTKAVGYGTGLGLPISYGIIQNHGGKIKVESEVGHGSNFTITLPVGSNQA